MSKILAFCSAITLQQAKFDDSIHSPISIFIVNGFNDFERCFIGCFNRFFKTSLGHLFVRIMLVYYAEPFRKYINYVVLYCIVGVFLGS